MESGTGGQAAERLSSADSVTPAVGTFEQAVSLHGHGRDAEAEALYRAVLQKDPGCFDALHNLSVLLAQSGKPEEAIGLLRKALDRNPSSAEAQNHLGLVLQSTGRHEEAILHHERAICAREDYLEAHFALGAALQATDRHEDAILAYERAIAIDTNFAEAHYNLGIALQALGRPDDAMPYYEKALDVDPDYVDAHLGLGSALLALGRGPEASAEFAVANSLKPGSAPQMAREAQNPEASLDKETDVTNTRLNRYIGSFFTNHNNPKMGMYPGLTSRAWHDPTGFPIVSALEGSYEAICREIAALEDASYHSEIERMTRSGSWDVLLFYERGKKNVENCERCPTITGIIERHNTVRTLAGLMYVSKMSPGTNVRPHRGPTNMRLRCHLGIKVPKGDCGIRVGDETRRWTGGRCVVFDDSFVHEAWNRTDRNRIVLIVDVWHPDLSPREVAFLEGLHRYGEHQARSLMRYWNENALAAGQRLTDGD